MLYKIKSNLLRIFGCIRVFKYPFWAVYNPATFAAKGAHYRQASRIIKPGDILLRGYNEYLDGYFIPGAYSHSCVYVGGERRLVLHAMSPGVIEDDLVDFLRCDRFCILRPRDGTKTAVKLARSNKGIPYDYNFEIGTARFYCHEFTASCFPGLSIEPKTPVWFKGLVSSKRRVYLAESFLTSSDFELIMEFNPKEQKYFPNNVSSLSFKRAYFQ